VFVEYRRCLSIGRVVLLTTQVDLWAPIFALWFLRRLLFETKSLHLEGRGPKVSFSITSKWFALRQWGLPVRKLFRIVSSAAKLAHMVLSDVTRNCLHGKVGSLNR
jgi:hypothetical protein